MAVLIVWVVEELVTPRRVASSDREGCTGFSREPVHRLQSGHAEPRCTYDAPATSCGAEPHQYGAAGLPTIAHGSRDQAAKQQYQVNAPMNFCPSFEP